MMLKGICGVRDEKGLCDKEEIKKVCVMGERGYLSRTSRPRNAFSPPHPPSLENRKRVFTSNI